MSTEAVAVIEAESRVLSTMESAPQTVLLEAHQAAKALQQVIANKAKPVLMNGEQYLEFEDWQTLGRFYGITPKLESLEFVEFHGEETVRGFRATSVALRAGAVISRADAYCLSDEEKWATKPKYAYCYVLKSGGTSEEDPGPDEIVWEANPSKPGKNRPQKVRQLVGEEKVPLYQLASMAQTRANAKCLRNVLAWVAVLAGYRPTPAEELNDAPEAPRAQPRPVPPGPDLSGQEWPNDPTAHERHDVEPARPAQPTSAPRVGCPQCGKPAGASKFPKPGKTHYCYSCRHSFDPGASK